MFSSLRAFKQVSLQLSKRVTNVPVVQFAAAAGGSTDHQYTPRLPAAMLQSSKVIAESAKGSWIFGKDGKKYLDLQTGIGVVSVGHCHPKVVKAAQDQAGKMIHAQMNCLTHQPMLTLVDKLADFVPARKSSDKADQWQFFFANSGAEAIENSVKLARHATGRQSVIVFQGGFHGRTIGAGSLTTAKYVYRAGFQPAMSGVFVAPYPYCLHCPCATTAGPNAKIGQDKECCGYALQQTRQLLQQQTSGAEVAAILFEPVLGEGGYVAAPASFVKGLRQLADEIGALLIVDEVQSGFGRTGKNFAIEHYGVVPDILVMAKGIASGFPLSAIAAPRSIMSKARPGSMGGTYGGNIISCAAANAVIDVIKEEKIVDNAAVRGKQFLAGIQQLQKKYSSHITNVRGLGLMLAVEFSGKSGTASAIAKAAEERGLLLLTAGIYECLRLIPPLTISEAEVNTALSLLDASIGAVCGAHK